MNGPQIDQRGYDLAVIGAGSGGMAAACRAAAHGLSVVVFEPREIGGTCVNRGCVPKKLMVHAARGADTAAELPGLGWAVDAPDFDWSVLRKTLETETERLSAVHEKKLADDGIAIVAEKASLQSAHEVSTESGDTYRADRILISTGARPRRPDFPGAEHCLVSDDIFTLESLPGRVAIIGGGYIAVEFASMLHRFGCEVTLFERGDRLIRNFDAEIGRRLEHAFTRQGIAMRFGDDVERIEKCGSTYRVVHGDTVEGEFDLVLAAIGRVPNSEGLGLANSGIETERGFIGVDEDGRTSVSNIFAVGDVADPLMLTPVAVRAGRRLVDLMLDRNDPLPRATNVPTATFTTPECGGVGATEKELVEKDVPFEIRRARFQPLTAAFGGFEKPELLMKALVAKDGGELLGLHFFGPYASEAVQMGAIALSAGLTEDELHHTMSLHPTIAEEVIGLGRPDTPLH